MKYCPQCNRQFTDAWLSFCSDDGTPLLETSTPAPEPTSVREPQVKTPDEQETQWLPREPPVAGGWIAPDERPPMRPGPWQPPPPPAPYTPAHLRRTQPSQGLAIASMTTGVVGLMLAFCLGPIPGIVALVLGLVSLSQIKKWPEKYSGKPFAIAGVVIGGVTVLFYVLLFLWVIFSSALS